MHPKSSAVPISSRDVLLVGLGGCIGTLVRACLVVLIPSVGPFPTAICLINISGAFILGWLLAVLSPISPESDRSRAARLFFGTGLLGGYTTYSTFAVDERGFILAGDMGTALLFGLPTAVLGIVAAAAGSALVKTSHARGIRRTRS
ncbi:fluoride efflux transporter FluC [Microbacterium sp. P01]|uniref:fluoride efflux transporter FluC n=1 Tax=unclassified Microbacterium TaxID=2609290 RepID=UPI00366DAE00